MNRTITTTMLIGLFVALFISGDGKVWGQTDRFFRITDRDVSFDTACGLSQCREVLFLNVGNRAITITAIRYPSSPFALDPSTPISTPLVLLPGDTVRRRFCYSPTSPEGVDADKVVLTIDTGKANAPAFDTLTLNGLSRSAFIQIDPPTINFGNVTIGGQSCATVTIRNNGNEPINLATLDQLHFPFAPGGIPATLLLPGKEIQAQICFAPITTEEFHDTLILSNGPCREPAMLTVEGKGLKVVSNIGPVLQVVSVDFDTARCGETKCRSIIIRNVGTGPLQVSDVDPIPAPFSGAISPLPATVEANQEQAFTFCYSPISVPSKDSVQINFLADNRVPLSIAAVFDISGSMKTPFGNFGSNRIASANAAGRSFLSNLVNDPPRNVVDEGGVYSFGGLEDFVRLQNFTDDRMLLEDAVPNSAEANFTCIYNAVIRVSAELGTRNIPGRRVMVLLTDGENSCPDSPETLAQAITAAKSAGIRIYAIGIGTANAADLTMLAEETGGFFTEALNPTDLLDSYQRIANALSKKQPSFFTLKGSAVAPDLEVSATDLAFDSVRTGGSRCKTFTLRNTGDAPLAITSFIRPTTHFTVTPAILPELEPGEEVTVEVCFHPGQLRGIDSIITFGYTNCVPQSKSVTLHGIGYDSVVVELEGSYTARPGSTITVPVRLTGRIPKAWETDSLQLTFGYNKTMLYPQPEDRPVTIANGAAATLTTQQAVPIYDSNTATLTVILSGGQLISLSADTLLVELNLLALHGNSLLTPITLKSARFADGNPKVGIKSSGEFLADSLCFQEDRLIDASPRFNPIVKLVSQNDREAIVGITLPETDQVQIRGDLFDPLGRHIAKVFEGEEGAGQYEMKIDLSNLPQGSYWLRLLFDDEEQKVMTIIVRN